MARSSRRHHALLLLALFAAPFAHAQLSTVPDLSTATETTAATTTSDSSSAASTTSESTDAATTTPATTDAATTDSTTASFITSADSSATSYYSLSNAPTIAGAGIPTIGVPYTAGAPFMQKSDMPEGTVFIIIGAILAFFGACVLLWRGLVAWSINRSVKRAAHASVRGGASEKTGSAWGGGSGYNPIKGAAPYRDSTWAGSSMSLDALTSAGKPVKPFKDADMGRSSPPPNLFFSPTAETRHSMVSMGGSSNLPGNRSSTYLPAGYYASPSAHAAGGEQRTVVGGSLAPYARNSAYNPSPPASPGLPPSSRMSTGGQYNSRDGLRPPGSRDGAAASRPSYTADRSSTYTTNRHSYMDRSSRPSTSDNTHSYLPPGLVGAGPSSSSLALNLPGSHIGGLSSGSGSESNLGGSRAPSAYLEDLMENHGHGPRERF